MYPSASPLPPQFLSRQLTDASHRVKGKLPGGIDLIIRALANQHSGYVHDIFLEWFEECQSTTINLRLFGVDKVGPSFDRDIPLTITCSSSPWILSTSSSC